MKRWGSDDDALVWARAYVAFLKFCLLIIAAVVVFAFLGGWL